jgi:ADP-heptose:LPS heptosyltransferase
MAARQEIRQTFGAIARIALDTAVIAAAPATAARVGERAACIVQLGAIGDFVLWMDAGRRLVAHCRAGGARRIVLVGHPAWADWARGLALADEVWAVDPARLDGDMDYRAHWLRRMRAAGFAEVLQPTHSRTAMWGDALVRASGAARRVGSAGDTANTPAWLKRIADGWFTELIACGAEARMELLRHADFLRGLGVADYRASAPALEAGPAPAGLPAAYAVLAPGAGWDGRAWPQAAFADIGRRLAGQGVTPVVAGGDADHAAAQALVDALPPGAQDWAGRTTLAELASLLAGARVVVANESAAAHIAAAAGAPVVCVLGGGHYGRFMPYEVEVPGRNALTTVEQKMECYGCNWHCIHARGAGEPVKCVREVAPEAVWRAVEASLTRP